MSAAGWSLLQQLANGVAPVPPLPSTLPATKPSAVSGSRDPPMYNLSRAVDIAFQVDESALRTVARAHAAQMAQGPELLLVNTDSAGAPMALNSLLNLQRLGYKHVLVVGYDGSACETLGAAAARLPPHLGQSLFAIPCLSDSWWARHVAAKKRYHEQTRQGAWILRWAVFARLVRLGYNVLSFDTDGALLDDVYRHLHSRALCGRFSLMYASDYEVLSPWLQTGFAYACGGARDGAAAWVVAEVVDRYLRFAEACGGAIEAEPDDTGTPCPAGSWLLSARRFDGFNFDQYIHRGVVHSSATRDGRMWWSQLEDMSSSAWPWAPNRSACLEVEATARTPGISMLPRAGPAPRAGVGSRGPGLTQEAPTHQWTRSDLLAGLEDAKEDVSSSWPRRFGLGAGSKHRDAYWASLRPAVPLATQLPLRAGAALDYEVACHGIIQTQKMVIRGDPNSATAGACRADVPPPLASHERGLLPHRRGRMSRAWQAVLDADLQASGLSEAPGARHRRLSRQGGGAGGTARAPAYDAVGGARWAAAPSGDEAVVLLPPWIVSHWTVAQQGLAGSVLPRTVFLHATNANKELTLKANGYWFWQANLARSPQDESPEASIFGPAGARPRVVAYAPPSGAAADGLSSPDQNTHETEVLTPLLLAAIASGRVAALPDVDCAGVPWASKAWSTPADRKPAAAPYAFGECRTGRCNFNMLAVGTASEEQRAVDAALVSDLGYASPFAGADADAERVASAPLRCMPMAGSNSIAGRPPEGRPPLQALDAPAWDRYARLLGDAATPPRAPTANALAGKVAYAELVRSMRAFDDAQVVYLPRRRLKVLDVPKRVQKWCGDCKHAASTDEYDVEGATALEGFCAETKTGDAGYCDFGDKGSWRLGEEGFTDVRACLTRCAQECARCDFVSVSLQEKDCSWYSSSACDPTKLRSAGLGHRTFAIDSALRRALKRGSRGGRGKGGGGRGRGRGRWKDKEPVHEADWGWA